MTAGTIYHFIHCFNLCFYMICENIYLPIETVYWWARSLYIQRSWLALTIPLVVCTDVASINLATECQFSEKNRWQTLVSSCKDTTQRKNVSWFIDKETKNVWVRQTSLQFLSNLWSAFDNVHGRLYVPAQQTISPWPVMIHFIRTLWSTI